MIINENKNQNSIQNIYYNYGSIPKEKKININT